MIKIMEQMMKGRWDGIRKMTKEEFYIALSYSLPYWEDRLIFIKDFVSVSYKVHMKDKYGE